MPDYEKNSKRLGIPSENQVREFWEWCGFKFYPDYNWPEKGWYGPNGEKLGYCSARLDGLPDISLDNIFKYAVPKLQQTISPIYVTMKWEVNSESWEISLCDIKNDSKDPSLALALFWAIMEVIHGSK